MPKSKNSQDEPGLFDVPEPVKAPTARRNGDSAATVVAAYVDTFRAHHGGGEPLKADKGRVARDAASLIRTGQATITELTQAATEMGKGRYANLGMQLKILRDQAAGRGKSRGMTPVISRHDPCWAEMAEQADAQWRAAGVA